MKQKAITKANRLAAEQKAQSAIEYLLLIGAAVLVVAVVITMILYMLQQGKAHGTQANQDFNNQIQDLNSMKRS